jgi:hypothetical protein
MTIGNGKPYQLNHFINIVEKNVGKQAVIEVLPKQPGDVDHTCADITKAKELLNYNPKVSFEDGIAQTFKWYKEFYTMQAIKHQNINEISINNDNSSNGNNTDIVIEERMQERQLNSSDEDDIIPDEYNAIDIDAIDLSSIMRQRHSADEIHWSSTLYDLETDSNVVKAPRQLAQRSARNIYLNESELRTKSF